MARADLPALDVRSIRDDPKPPQHWKLVRLAINHVFLELSQQGALFSGIGFLQHSLIEIDFWLVIIHSVIFGIDRAWQIFLRVHQWVDNALTIGLQDDIEIAAAHRLEPDPSAPHAASRAVR